MIVRVLTASQASAWDRASIASGTPSIELMRRAGQSAAQQIMRRFPDALTRGVAAYAGNGNNGGDAWVVAGALRATGVTVRVFEAEPPRTDDARAERARASVDGAFPAPLGTEPVVVDGVLGIGARGAPRGAAADAISRIRRAREHGARVIALDLPSGLDADTGENESVVADVTLTFGAMKRGLLTARDKCGAIVVLEIGLVPDCLPVGAPLLAEEEWVMSRVPPIAADAHKGDRKRIAIVGGAQGMAGAVILAGRAALRSGAGLVRVVAQSASVPAVQAALPEALADEWPTADRGLTRDWAHAIAIGPGLGAGADARGLVERLVRESQGPIVLDADALNAFVGDLDALASLARGRTVVLTPHPMEFSRLAGTDVAGVLARRWEIGTEVARRTGAIVLLKGVPTIVSAPDGRVAVVARGTPALATGGSGDVLSGIAATLLAQMSDPFEAVVCAAWAHGRAAELSHEGRSPRGVVLSDILEALGHVWNRSPSPPGASVIAELPAIAT